MEYLCAGGTYSNRTSLQSVGQCTPCDPGMYCSGDGKHIERDFSLPQCSVLSVFLALSFRSWASSLVLSTIVFSKRLTKPEPDHFFARKYGSD